MLCFIHHEAYVLNRTPCSGSKESTARKRPRLPSSIKSPSVNPRHGNFFAILTTSLRLLRTSLSLASGSCWSMISSARYFSSSQLSSGDSSISLRYSLMVASNAMVHSPAQPKSLSTPAIRAIWTSTLLPFYRTLSSMHQIKLFEISVKYACGFTTLKFSF